MDPPEMGEMVFWAWTLCKTAEELKQLKIQARAWRLGWKPATGCDRPRPTTGPGEQF